MDEDIEFVRKILPKSYIVTPHLSKHIRCISADGIKIGNDGEDEEHWGYIYKAIKKHFDDRLDEIYHYTCTFHCDFIISLK